MRMLALEARGVELPSSSIGRREEEESRRRSELDLGEQHARTLERSLVGSSPRILCLKVFQPCE